MKRRGEQVEEEKKHYRVLLTSGTDFAAWYLQGPVRLVELGDVLFETKLRT